MLAHIRAFAKSPFAAALMFLLVISFAIFGIRDVFRTQGFKDSVIEAGSRTIASAKFRTYFENYKKQIEQQQQGQPVTQDDLIKANVDGRLADELATEEALAEMTRREGVRPSDKLVVDQIRQAKRFFDPITGKFDEKSYKTYLAQNGLTAADLEGELRDQTAQNHFGAGLGAGMKAPMIYSALAAAYGQEGRSLRYFIVTPAQVAPPAQPTEDQLKAFMKENAAQLMKPETRVVSVARFSATLLAPTVKVDPADIQKRFDFEKDSLSKPELRTVQQLVLKDAAQAADAAKRVASGQDPAAVAKALGVAPPLVLTDSPKSRIVDPKVADSAFSLKVGETSGPIQGALGWAVVKVFGVTPGHAVTLDEVRGKVEEEAKKAAAADKAYELSKNYDAAHTSGSNLIDSAKKVGAPVLQLPPITKEGRTPAGQQLQLPPKLLQQAFTLAKGGETEGVEEAAPGEYYAIRIEQVNPQAPFTLDEIRAPITQRIMQQDVVKRVQAKANELADKVKKGASIDAVAAAAGAKIETIPSLARNDRQAMQALGQEFMGAVFAAKKGDTTTGPTQTGLAVIKVEGIVAGTPDAVARQAVAQRAAIASSLNQDVAASTRLAARSIVKPKIDLKRARQAVGGDPNTVAGATIDPAKSGTKSDAKSDPKSAKPAA